jgi:hypothetical protein
VNDGVFVAGSVVFVVESGETKICAAGIGIVVAGEPTVVVVSAGNALAVRSTASLPLPPWITGEEVPATTPVVTTATPITATKGEMRSLAGAFLR